MTLVDDNAQNGRLRRGVEPQREILGYGRELTDSLAQYSAAEQRDEKQVLLKHYANWLGRATTIRKHLCFADVYCRPEGSDAANEAVALLIMPKRNEAPNTGHRRYRAALGEFWGENVKRAIAPHAVFSAGLPVYPDGESPATQGEATRLHETRKHEHPEAGFFLAEVTPEVGCPDELHVGADITFAEDDLQQDEKLVASDVGRVFESVFDSDKTQELSTHSIFELWQHWQRVFSKRGQHFQSNVNSPLGWITVVPVGYFETDASGFTCIATLFLGFDRVVAKGHLFDTMRYILLNLMEANLTYVARRHARDRQRYLFAHEALAKVQTILADSKFSDLSTATQDATRLLQVDVLLWNTLEFLPAKLRDVDLADYASLARRLAWHHLDSKLNLKKALQEGIPPDENEKVLSRLRNGLSRPGSSKEAFFDRAEIGPPFRARLKTNWPHVLEAVLVCGLRQSLVHGCIAAELAHVRDLFDPHPFHREVVSTPGEAGLGEVGVVIQVSTRCFHTFDPHATTEWQVIYEFARKTSGAILVQWDVMPCGDLYESTCTIYDSSAYLL